MKSRRALRGTTETRVAHPRLTRIIHHGDTEFTEKTRKKMKLTLFLRLLK